MITTFHFISWGGTTSLEVIKAQRPGGKLYRLVKTTGIICNNPKAPGIRKAINFGFPVRNIKMVLRRKGDIGQQMMDIMDKFQFDFFHQLGWMVHTPRCITEKYRGLNQHLGQGGDFMYGHRRIYAHMRFSQIIGECRPIPIFCQFVDPDYDQGDAVFVQYANWQINESVNAIASRLLPIEHQVQIEALRLLATGEAQPFPVPKVFTSHEEKEIMDQVRQEADDYYRKRERAKRKDPVYLIT